MKSRCLRVFLLLVVIPAFLGIIPRASSAYDSEMNEPDTVVEVRAYNTRQQAASITRQRVVDRVTDDESMAKREKQLFLDDFSVTAGTKLNTMDDLSSIVQNVAGRLNEIQRTSDGGWPRDLIDSKVDPDAVLPDTTYGLIGMGLLMAYQMSSGLQPGTLKVIPGTNSVAFLAAAQNAGNKLKPRATSDSGLVSTDIIFLYGLSRVVDPVNYITNEYYTAGHNGLKAFITRNPTAENVHNLYNSTNDPDLRQTILWQLASWVEAAKLYAPSGADSGATITLDTWANNLMSIICSSICQDDAGGFFYMQSSGKNYVRTAGHAKVVEVLKRFYSNDDNYKQSLKKGIAYLRNLQGMSGSFSWGAETTGNIITPWTKVTLQDQCYGIQAMAYNFQTTWKKRDNSKGSHWGANYLIRSMMATGPDGYEVFVDRVDYDPANPLVDENVAVPRCDRNSEAIQALYYSCKEGDVKRSGNILAGNALEVVKARIGLRPLNGPEIVAADRTNDGSINDDDILAILSDAVANHEERPIFSFLGR